MTPLDSTMITGLGVGGDPIPLDLDIGVGGRMGYITWSTSTDTSSRYG